MSYNGSTIYHKNLSMQNVMIKCSERNGHAKIGTSTHIKKFINNLNELSYNTYKLFLWVCMCCILNFITFNLFILHRVQMRNGIM